MKQPYTLIILYCQYRVSCCPGDFVSQGISRHGIGKKKQEYSVSSIIRVHILIQSLRGNGSIAITITFCCHWFWITSSYIAAWEEVVRWSTKMCEVTHEMSILKGYILPKVVIALLVIQNVDKTEVIPITWAILISSRISNFQVLGGLSGF